ncbi:Uu.00g019280.m01.CDS01 [Anthostomella pinea]|uniref:Uu.00g019280.m01.CDS01 n=1 Tax=Anthostomella pinea TaxID=933095 RepID=A0AAI8VZ85_9PEZI|nr:Uu.00g019280.m01.CDS01 [Anthostomella pinea]
MNSPRFDRRREDFYSLPSRSRETRSHSYISPVPQNRATFLPSVPGPSQYALSADWSENHRSQGTSLLRVEPARDYRPASASNLSHPIKSNMSAVAVSFDPRMEMGIPRSSFSWPGLSSSLDSGSDLLGHDLSSVDHGSDPSLSPPTSRSPTSSPPRPILTPEQRELKRQRDQARRDSKSSHRAHRAMSTHSYSSASQSPPVTMSEFSTSPMPVYTTAPSQISLLAEPVTTMSGHSYIPSYSASPLPEHGNSHMFSPHFSSLPSHDYMNMHYSHHGYPPPPSAHSLSSQYSSRASSMSESGMMYPVQAPILPSGNVSVHDNGHVRVVQSRPKPQCWEHGCNGRQFSTFSNLLRHQREKSGQASKASCPNCGAEFTRTTARNGHLLHDKCKARRNSNS